jgi:hypothetical protein
MAPKARKKKKKETTPKQMISGGFFLVCIAVVAYFYIGHAEQTNGSFRLPVIIVPVYKVLGKWGIVGLVAGIGILSLAMGVHELRKKRAVRPQAGDEVVSADAEQPPAMPRS